MPPQLWLQVAGATAPGLVRYQTQQLLDFRSQLPAPPTRPSEAAEAPFFPALAVSPDGRQEYALGWSVVA